MPYGLGRIHLPDQRDQNYLFARKLDKVVTATTGSKFYEVPHLYDQGQTNHCVGWSHAGYQTAVEYLDFTDKTLIFDGLGIYQWANANDGIAGPHEGSTVRAGMECLRQVGAKLVAPQNLPDEPASGYNKTSNYLWADISKPDHGISDVINWILTVSPVVFGINWFNDMYTPDGNGFIHPTGGLAGGHAILCRGVDTAAGYFLLRNSWGAWGINNSGDAKISISDMENLLSQDGEAAAAVDVIDTPVFPPQPSPVPNPAPQPTPNPQPAPTPSPVVPPFTRTLRLTWPRMRGADVQMWQRQVHSRGYRVGIDGVYWLSVGRVCKAFQADHGLPVTGQVDQTTWKRTWTP